MVLQVCLNGDHEAGVPRSPSELADAARACIAAGAVSLHAHPRDPDGHESLEAADIAAAVAFLCSREASWMTGEVLRVSGGLEGVSAAPPKRAKT